MDVRTVPKIYSGSRGGGAHPAAGMNMRPLTNERSQTLKCSHYIPAVIPENTALPCVIYCHGNSGCRADANEAAVILLPSNITLFTLDFAGSGLSDGEYVSLGWHEVKMAVQYMRRVIQKRAKFDIMDLNVVQFAPKTFIPALFGHASNDMFIQPHHTDRIHQTYAGDKNLIKFEGDHNSARPQFYYDSVSIFFYNVLHPPQFPLACSNKLDKYSNLGDLKAGAGTSESLLYEIINGLRAAGSDAGSSSAATTNFRNATKSVVELLTERVNQLSVKNDNDLDFLLDENHNLTDVNGNAAESHLELTDKMKNAAHTPAQTERAGEDVPPWAQQVMDHLQASDLEYLIRNTRHTCLTFVLSESEQIIWVVFLDATRPQGGVLMDQNEDSNGEIDKEELKHCFQKLEISFTEEEITDLFEACDINEDMGMKFNEFIVFLCLVYLQ
ncbi:hypothetical protein PR202_gb27876 [Eleusine coracana subsp. coracana]|uniref:Calmodulin n=1 Tax=Eleusine coracana subsp. coracana TaxID=191504 RepID=A0AAV5FUZ9_ELECO|nr:hypothetical protein PR202_gb27876 [Eleusine coracana subsp. coracana]